ncbi:MAG TPA: hypothetical protein VI320_30055 [Terracidiphilus sp.]
MKTDPPRNCRRPTWLESVQPALDRAAFAFGLAYPVEHNEVLRHPLELNLDRARGRTGVPRPVLAPEKAPGVDRLPTQWPAVNAMRR